MSSVFLKRVELSNFRVYGESYVFELPDRPSVTLITGANGLGKTSFFDGIEWALTGQVSRFQDIKTDGRRREIDPLTRIGTAADGHRVSLKFTDGPTIDRGGGYEVDEARLIELLKRDTWPFISNLHGYLSITHFLGQASTRRFSLREPRNQWEALKGPAGVDRINSLREKLCGQGARQAFTRAIRERAQSLQAATDKLEEWNRLKIECARLSLLATSERSISPERVLADAEQLVERLRAMGTDVASDLNVTAMNPEVMLAQVGEVLGRIEALNERDAVRIRELEAILSGFAEAQQQTDTKSQLAAETTQHRAEQIGKLPQAEQDFAEASSAVTRSEQHAAHISANAALLSRVGDAVASLTKAEQIERDLDSQLTTCRAAIRSAEEQLKNAEDAAAVSRQLRAERASIAGVFNNVQLRARLFTSFTHSRAEIARLSALLDGRNLDALRAVRTSIATSVSAAAAEVNRLTTELRESDNKAQELASAVLMIAHRLEHDDTTCPVCSSEFEPGILKELAENQAKRESGGLTTLATALADARAKHDGLSRELATADQGISELDQLMRSLAAEQERAASLQQDMITAGGALDQSYGATDISAAQEQLDAIDERLNREPSLDSLDGAVAGARTIVDAARVREAGLEQQRASTRAAVER